MIRGDAFGRSVWDAYRGERGVMHVMNGRMGMWIRIVRGRTWMGPERWPVQERAVLKLRGGGCWILGAGRGGMRCIAGAGAEGHGGGCVGAGEGGAVRG